MFPLAPNGPLKSLRTFALWIVLAFGLVMLLASALPLALGDRSYVVRSGSMSPAIDTGDIVVVEPVPASEIAVGDIVTFQDPDGSGRLITHRARAIEPGEGKLSFTTQGDANTGQEQWDVPPDGTVGKVAYRVPMLGFAAAKITQPGARIALIVLPAALLAISLLASIWRRDPEEVADELPA